MGCVLRQVWIPWYSFSLPVSFCFTRFCSLVAANLSWAYRFFCVLFFSHLRPLFEDFDSPERQVDFFKTLLLDLLILAGYQPPAGQPAAAAASPQVTQAYGKLFAFLIVLAAFLFMLGVFVPSLTPHISAHLPSPLNPVQVSNSSKLMPGMANKLRNSHSLSTSSKVPFLLISSLRM